MTKKEIKTHQKENGQSLLELAVSLVVLLVLLSGVVDLGRSLFTISLCVMPPRKGPLSGHFILTNVMP